MYYNYGFKQGVLMKDIIEIIEKGLNNATDKLAAAQLMGDTDHIARYKGQIEAYQDSIKRVKAEFLEDHIRGDLCNTR